MTCSWSLRSRLSAALRALGDMGCSEGVAGHVTVRDPDRPHELWVNPFGMHFSDIGPHDLLRIDARGRVVAGDGILNAAAFAIHAAIHRARPDVGAAAHTHSPNGRLLSLLEQGPEALDAVLRPGSGVGWFDDYTGVVLDEDEGRRIAATLGEGCGLVLRNHGTLTVGRTIEEAAWRHGALERAGEAAALALMAARGTGAMLPADAGLVDLDHDAHGWGSSWLARFTDER